MARSGLVDPLDKYRFTVDVEGFSKAAFATCGTPSHAITAQTYAEGGAHLNPRKIVDTVEYRPITLSRGVTNDTSFVKWATGFIDLVQNNRGTKSIGDIGLDTLSGLAEASQAQTVPSSTSYPFSYRRKVKISHVDRAGITQVVYVLYNAFVIEYKPASDFDASADDGVSMETLVIGYEGYDVKYTGIAGTLGSLAASLP